MNILVFLFLMKNIEIFSIYRNIVFSIKIKGDKTTPGADLGDNDFVGKPEIVSCEAIVYTKDGDGWIGAKIEKK